MFTEAAFEANKETNVKTNKEYEADKHARTSVVTQVNKHNVVPSETQLDSSRTLHVTAFLPLPLSQATADIDQTKSNVKKQNSEILTGAPIKAEFLIIVFFRARVIGFSVPFHPCTFCEINIEFWQNVSSVVSA
jgi:hypothetical protein